MPESKQKQRSYGAIRLARFLKSDPDGSVIVQVLPEVYESPAKAATAAKGLAPDNEPTTWAVIRMVEAFTVEVVKTTRIEVRAEDDLPFTDPDE